MCMVCVLCDLCGVGVLEGRCVVLVFGVVVDLGVGWFWCV